MYQSVILIRHCCSSKEDLVVQATGWIRFAHAQENGRKPVTLMLRCVLSSDFMTVIPRLLSVQKPCRRQSDSASSLRTAEGSYRAGGVEAMKGGSPPSILEEPAEGRAGDTSQALPPGMHQHSSRCGHCMPCLSYACMACCELGCTHPFVGPVRNYMIFAEPACPPILHVAQVLVTSCHARHMAQSMWTSIQ